MSGDARISTGFPAHPKTKKLIRRLGAGAAWNLVCLFLWAAGNKSDGSLSGMSDEDIELAAQWNGDEGAFVAVLVDIRFLDGEEGDYEVHDWADHNPWVCGSKARSNTAKQNAARKWGRDLDSDNKQKRSERLAAARAIATHTAEEWSALRAICGPACLRCGKVDGEIVKDHIVPIYKGGSDGISNLQPLCRSCNAAKGPDCSDLRPANWAERLRNACGTPANPQITPAPSPSPSPLPKQKQKQEQASPNGSRLATDWQLPDDWREWAEAERPGVLVYEEAAKFADYWHSLPGAKARKTNWFKTWCNWIRNSRAVSNARASPSAAPSRRLQTLQSLEDLKNGLDYPRDSDRISETFLLGPGAGAGWGCDDGNGDGVG